MAFRPPIARSLALSANPFVWSLPLVISKINARDYRMAHLLENEGLILNEVGPGRLGL